MCDAEKQFSSQMKGPPPLSFPKSRKSFLHLPPCIIHAAFGLSVRHGPFTESPVNLLAVNRRVPRLEISSFRDSEEDGGQWREPGSTLIRALVNMLSKQANMIWTRNPRFINFESEKFSDERARLTLYVKTHPCQAEMRQYLPEISYINAVYLWMAFGMYLCSACLPSSKAQVLYSHIHTLVAALLQNTGTNLFTRCKFSVLP